MVSTSLPSPSRIHWFKMNLNGELRCSDFASSPHPPIIHHPHSTSRLALCSSQVHPEFIQNPAIFTRTSQHIQSQTQKSRLHHRGLALEGRFLHGRALFGTPAAPCCDPVTHAVPMVKAPCSTASAKWRRFRRQRSAIAVHSELQHQGADQTPIQHPQNAPKRRPEILVDCFQDFRVEMSWCFGCFFGGVQSDPKKKPAWICHRLRWAKRHGQLQRQVIYFHEGGVQPRWCPGWRAEKDGGGSTSEVCHERMNWNDPKW